VPSFLLLQSGCHHLFKDARAIGRKDCVAQRFNGIPDARLEPSDHCQPDGKGWRAVAGQPERGAADHAGSEDPTQRIRAASAPSDKPAAEAKVENQADQLRGISDASKDDPSYQRAYRECMKGRGF